MKICVDATPLSSPSGGGIHSYTKNLLKHLPLVARDHEIFVVTSKLSHSIDEEIRELINQYQVLSLPMATFSNILSISMFLSGLLKKHGIQYFIATRYTSPFFPQGIKIVPVIYDLFYRNFDYHMPLKARLLDHLTISNSIKKASTIVCISNYTAECVKKDYHTLDSKIKIAYAGYDRELFSPSSDEPFKDELKTRFNAEYLIFASDIYNPRKNFRTLVRAVNRLPATLKRRIALIGCGPLRNAKLRDEIDIECQNAGIADKFHWSKNLNGGEMAKYYNAADLLFYVTKEEGFGLPILEAMACSTPVICANIGASPEVAGEAAFKLDPDDVPAIAETIEKILTNRQVSHDLQIAGLKNVTKFSWKSFADQLISAVETD